MRTFSLFSFYIHDVRHIVPTLAFVTVADERKARAIAKELLMESLDHLAIEMREDDHLLFHLDRNGAVWTRPGVGESPSPMSAEASST